MAKKVTEEILEFGVQDPELQVALVNHMIYSFKDVKSYDELTDEEKSFISEKTFNILRFSIDFKNGYYEF